MVLLPLHKCNVANVKNYNVNVSGDRGLPKESQSKGWGPLWYKIFFSWLVINGGDGTPG